MKILLLDDEKTILRALFLGLKRAGHQATETNHPTEMLRKIRQENFDLLILDYHLSILSGLDLLKILDINNKNIPALILSSKHFTEKEIANFDLQTEQVLSKDKPIAEILQDIEHYMESHGTHLKRR